jgi:hypothetical protein
MVHSEITILDETGLVRSAIQKHVVEFNIYGFSVIK